MVCVRYLCKKANNASNAAYQLGFTDMQKLSSLNQLIVFILRLIYLVFNKKSHRGIYTNVRENLTLAQTELIRNQRFNCELLRNNIAYYI